MVINTAIKGLIILLLTLDRFPAEVCHPIIADKITHIKTFGT